MLHKFIHSNSNDCYRMTGQIETRGHPDYRCFPLDAKLSALRRLTAQADYPSDIIIESDRKTQQECQDNDTFSSS